MTEMHQIKQALDQAASTVTYDARTSSEVVRKARRQRRVTRSIAAVTVAAAVVSGAVLASTSGEEDAVVDVAQDGPSTELMSVTEATCEQLEVGAVTPASPDSLHAESFETVKVCLWSSESTGNPGADRRRFVGGSDASESESESLRRTITDLSLEGRRCAMEDSLPPLEAKVFVTGVSDRTSVLSIARPDCLGIAFASDSADRRWYSPNTSSLLQSWIDRID